MYGHPRRDCGGGEAVAWNREGGFTGVRSRGVSLQLCDEVRVAVTSGLACRLGSLAAYWPSWRKTICQQKLYTISLSLSFTEDSSLMSNVSLSLSHLQKIAVYQSESFPTSLSLSHLQKTADYHTCSKKFPKWLYLYDLFVFIQNAYIPIYCYTYLVLKVQSSKC